MTQQNSQKLRKKANSQIQRSFSQKLSRDEIFDFAEKEDMINFDNQACKGFSFKKDFDKNKLFHFMDRTGIKYRRRNYIQLLENLKVAKREGSKVILNNAGALFFFNGKTYKTFIPVLFEFSGFCFL